MGGLHPAFEYTKALLEAGKSVVTSNKELVASKGAQLLAIAKAHNVHPAIICLKWAVQRGQLPIPFSIHENEYVSNLQSTVEDPLTDEEMETLRKADKNCRLIKGQVFLWPGATSWHDLWDEDGTITQ